MEADLIGAPPKRWEPTRLFFALLAAPIAWALHVTLTYPLVLLACRLGTKAPLHVATAATLLLAAAGGLFSFRLYWRARRKDPEEPRGDRERFVGLVGVALSALFLVAIVLESVPSWLNDPCR